jgi:hypothetical protein
MNEIAIKKSKQSITQQKNRFTIASKMIVRFAVIAICVSYFQSCAPVFSEMQSARTVGKNRMEITPTASSVSYSEEGETNGVQNQYGTQVAFGVTSSFDIRLRYEYVRVKNDFGASDTKGVHVMGIGPKYSLLKNKIAIALPIGRAFGEDTKDTWQLHPTILFTIPAVKDKFDLNISPKYLFTVCKDCEDFIALNFGASFSNDLNKWAIRPEYGLLYNPGVSGHFGQLSIGFSYAFNLK